MNQRLRDDLSSQLTFEEVLGAIAEEQKPATQTIAARPFLKWVGGKRSILDQLIQRMPPHYGAYRELFIGGGALFFAVQPANAHLSDINGHLIQAYTAVRDDVDELIRYLKIHQEKHSQAYFENAREELSTERNKTKVAALFIYLNKTCFNGLYRVNQSGKFNVPIGSYKSPTIFEEEVLRNASEVLQLAKLKNQSCFKAPVMKGDFYYLDPPYHKTFSSYDGSGFGDADHEKLAAFCKKVDAAGGLFMLSNSDTPFIRDLYGDFHLENVNASRSVSCKGNQRGREKELLVRNYR